MTYQGFPPPRSAPAHGGPGHPRPGDQNAPDAGNGQPSYGAAHSGTPGTAPSDTAPPDTATRRAGPVDARYGGPAGLDDGPPQRPEYGPPAGPEYGGPPGSGYSGPPGYGAGPATSRRQAGESGAAHGQRSLWFWSAVGLAVIGAAVVVVALVQGGGQSAPTAPGALVTSFLPNEIRQVPAACGAVPPAVLDQYIPGRSKPVAAQPLQGKLASECSWTADMPGRYRFMEVKLEAYTPSGLASGNGSATEAARDAFTTAKVGKQFPVRQSKQPRATVTGVAGLGQEAFSADQRYNRGAVLDMETLVVRDRNVLVTVIFEARVGGAYGPDQIGLLQTGAQAAAKAALSGLG